MATPIFSKITMTTRMGAEPWKRKRRRGVRRHVESLSKAALQQGSGAALGPGYGKAGRSADEQAPESTRTPSSKHLEVPGNPH